MKLKWIMFWFTVPQIRWEYGHFEYSFWWWCRRKGEWPNRILAVSRLLTDGAYEELYPDLPVQRLNTWTAWQKK